MNKSHSKIGFLLSKFWAKLREKTLRAAALINVFTVELLRVFLSIKTVLTNPMTFKRMVIGTSGLREEDDYERPNRCLPRNDDVWPS